MVSVSISDSDDKRGLPPQLSFLMLLWQYLQPEKHRALDLPS